jgi:hypothetical protein
MPEGLIAGATDRMEAIKAPGVGIAVPWITRGAATATKIK